MGFRVLSILFVTMLLDHMNAKPMETVDTCLFSCKYCFENAEEVMLKCANECLMNEYSKMKPVWKTICPYFGNLNFMVR